MQYKLIKWRNYNGFTQEFMAKHLGISLRTYINKEAGFSQFKADEMFVIANLLNMNIGEIFVPTNFMKHEIDKEVS